MVSLNKELVRKSITSDSKEIIIRNKSIERISNSNEYQNSLFDEFKNDLTLFDLSFNKLTKINSKIFKDLFNLRHIHLNNNRIGELLPELFYELFELESINLSLNRLAFLDTNLFFNNSNLTEINLSFNRLSNVNQKLFRNCVNLKMLRLEGNKIEHISSYAFENLIKLERIYLSYNLLEQLSKYLFKKCVCLKEIYLNNNQLNELDSAQFDYCLELTKLDLSNNSLTIVEENTFSKCLKLAELGLFNNKLENLSPNLFRSLKYLDILWIDTNQSEFLSNFSNSNQEDQRILDKIVAKDLKDHRLYKYDLVESFKLEDDDNNSQNNNAYNSEAIQNLRLSDSFGDKSTLIDQSFSNENKNHFSSSLFRFSPKNYRTLDFIGKGTFGKVYLVKDLNDGKLKAIKIMDKNFTGKGSKLQSSDNSDSSDSNNKTPDKPIALNEIEILETLKSLKNDYIVNYYEYFFQEDFICIVLEYCEKKDLSLMIQNQKKSNRNFPLSLIFEWFRQIIEAILFLHSNKIIHRDIKPDNIFVTGKKQLKLGDLGTAKSLEYLTQIRTFVGTLCYTSPEILKGLPYFYKTDIWSAGCVLYEMRMLKRLFMEDSLMQVVSNIVDRDISLEDDIEMEVRALLESMLKKDPENRVNAEDLLKRVKLLIQLLGNE